MRTTFRFFLGLLLVLTIGVNPAAGAHAFQEGPDPVPTEEPTVEPTQTAEKPAIEPPKGAAGSGLSMRIEVTALFDSSFPTVVFPFDTFNFKTLSLDPENLPTNELIAIDVINDGTEILHFDSSFSYVIARRQLPFGVSTTIDVGDSLLAPGQSFRMFLDIQAGTFAQSGPYEVGIEINPDGLHHAFTVEGDILVKGCDFDCPGPNIKVTDIFGSQVAGTYQIGPVVGQVMPLDFRIENVGTDVLSIIAVSESGDGRFSVSQQPTPPLVNPGGTPAAFQIQFDANGINADLEYTTQVLVTSNAQNSPDFRFTLKIKRVPFPMSVEVGPWPLAPQPIPAVNGVREMGDVTTPQDPALPGARRVTLRVFNTGNDIMTLSRFNARFSQGGTGLQWQWNDPPPPTIAGDTVRLHEGNGTTSGVFHFDGRFVIAQNAPPGPFSLEISFRYSSRDILETSHSFRITGFVAEHKAEITPTAPGFTPALPPSFTIETGRGGYYYVVEIAQAKSLLAPSVAARITESNRQNFYRSEAAQTDNEGRAFYAIPAEVWSNFHGSRLFYRVITSPDAAGNNPRFSTADSEAAQAPNLDITGAPWYGMPVNAVTMTWQGTQVVFTDRLNTTALSSDYGPRNVSGGSRFHPGLDIPFGPLPPQPIYAIAPGTVEQIGGSVNRVDILHGGYRSGYIHLSNDTLVASGEHVIAGQLIGYSGSAGTDNHHLHFDGGNGVFKNMLGRIRYIDQHRLPSDGRTFIGDSFTKGYEVDVSAAVGSQHKALVAFGVTTDFDKDLNFVQVKVNGSTAVGQYFQFDYDKVTGQNSGSGLVTFSNGTSALIGGLNDNIYGNTNLTQRFYVKPASTDVNQVAEDYFFFVWDTAPFQNDDTKGLHLIQIALEDASGHSAARDITLGTRIKTGNVQVSGTTITQVLTVSNYDIAEGRIGLAVQNLPAGWTASFSNASPLIAANGSAQATLTLNAPAPNAVLPSSAKAVATFSRIPDIKHAVSLGLDMSVHQVVNGNPVALPDQGEMVFDPVLQSSAALSRPVQIKNNSRDLDLTIAVQQIQGTAVGTGGVTRLVLAPGETKEFAIGVATGEAGAKEAIVTLSQLGVGSFSYRVKADIVATGTQPGVVQNFVGKINGTNLNGLTIYVTNPTIAFTWSQATHPLGIERYQVVLQPTDGSSGWLYNEQPLHPATSLTLNTSGLIVGKSYSVHIRARSTDGTWGPFTNGGAFSIAAPTGPSTVPNFVGKINGVNLNGLTIYVTNPTVVFTWSHATHPTGIERYQVVLQPTDGSSGWLYNEQPLYPATSLTLNTSGLVYGKSYSVHIRAKNNLGLWGDFVVGGAFNVTQSLPSTVPNFVGKINGASLNGLTVNYTNPAVAFTWSPASHPTGIQRYQIVLQPTDGSGWLYSPHVLAPATSYTLNTSGLVYGKSYSVHIRAMSNESIWGDFVIGGTFNVRAPDGPSVVPNFVGKINGVNLNGLTVNVTNPAVAFTWSPASHPTGIERYQIVLQPTDGSGWLYSPHVLAPATSYTLNTSGLVYGKSYSVHIRALNNLGLWGDFVAGGTFNVTQSPPSTVPNFVGKINGTNLSGLTVNVTNPAVAFTWSPASHPTGIQRYQIVFQSTDGSGWLYSPHVLAPATSYTLNTSGLVYDKSYSVHIRAMSNEGIWGDFVAGGTFTVKRP